MHLDKREKVYSPSSGHQYAPDRNEPVTTAAVWAALVVDITNESGTIRDSVEVSLYNTHFCPFL